MLDGPSMNSLALLSCYRSATGSISYLPFRLVLQAFLSQGEPGVKLYLGGEYPPQGAPADSAGGVSYPEKFTRYKVNIDKKEVLPLSCVWHPQVSSLLESVGFHLSYHTSVDTRRSY